MKIQKVVYEFLAGVVSILLISALPSLFKGGHFTSFAIYFKTLWQVCKDVVMPYNIVYQAGSATFWYSIFPDFWNYYNYSLIVFTISLIVAFCLGLLFACITMFFKARGIKRLQSFASFMQALPDIFFVFLVTLVVVIVYQQTHILLANVAGGFASGRAYLLPIIVLSMLPTFLFYKIILQIFMEEREENYYEFAVSKGLKMHSILFSHILRNALVRIMNHFNSVFWVMITNLVMIEWVFNIHGIMMFIIDRQIISLAAFVIICFYVPFYILILIIRLLLKRWTTKEVAL